MAKTLDDIRKKLMELNERRGGGGGNSNRDRTTYPHWSIPEGTSATLRLLPDQNPDNTFFWQERQLINLSFPGVKGHDENTPIVIKVPCIEMYEGYKNKCPILTEVRPMWKDKSMELLASKYWVKRSYFMQGFVKNDPIGETDTPENPIRRFLFTSEIFNIVKAALMDPDMEHLPVDYVNGTDLIITKTTKGKYADYSTSKWARKESSLTADQLAAIEEYGLVDLSTYLPEKPTPDHLNAQYEMFQASLAEELYDPERWGQFYKPYGLDLGGSAPTRPVASRPAAAPAMAQSRPEPEPTPAPAPAQSVVSDDSSDQADDAPVAAPAPATAGRSPKEILDMLRNRAK